MSCHGRIRQQKITPVSGRSYLGAINPDQNEIEETTLLEERENQIYQVGPYQLEAPHNWVGFHPQKTLNFRVFIAHVAVIARLVIFDHQHVLTPVPLG